MKLKHQPARLPLSELRSLGPTSAAALSDVGIHDRATLQRHGVRGAFALLRAQFGKRITVNWMYALECALRDIPWQLLETTRKAELKADAKRVIAELDGKHQ
jgi:DNA transformation protein